ncbi:hypothetical protein D7Z94_16100 [Ulvibacterium marinum]|uniref:Uncharacterized protein n=1 Tax=Ulvibacterium marinum TaxID=2419782 RepID=A0A3B0C3G3_9FLAO|nr:hypothetical protein D7Z94_16100 [Ulvibacterium marinum]
MPKHQQIEANNIFLYQNFSMFIGVSKVFGAKIILGHFGLKSNTLIVRHLQNQIFPLQLFYNKLFQCL